LIGLLFPFEGLQRHPEQPGCLLVRQRAGCLFPGPSRVVDGGGGVPEWCRLEEVMGDFRQVRPLVTRMDLAQHLGRLQVQPHPAGRRQFLIQRLAHKLVREPEPSEHARDGSEQPGFDGTIDGVEQLVGVHPAQPPERFGRELGAQNRGQRKRPLGSVVEMADPTTDHGSDALRHRHPERGWIEGLAELPLGCEESHGLPEEERVPLRLPAKGGDEHCGRRRPEGRTQESGDIVLVQAFEVDAPGRGFAGELRGRAHQRMLGRELDVAVRPDDQQARIRDLVGEEPQQEEGWRVGGMQVFQHQDERAAACRIQQERRRRVEQLEPRRVGVDGGGRGELREQFLDLREDLHEIDRRRTDLVPGGIGLLAAHVGPHDLHPRPIGRCASRLPASAPQDPGPARSRPRGELADQPALADPRFAGEEEQAPPPASGILETGRQLIELWPPADEYVLASAVFGDACSLLRPPLYSRTGARARHRRLGGSVSGRNEAGGWSSRLVRRATSWG